MEKKLWTARYINGKLDVRQKDYEVIETQYGISVTDRSGSGWSFLTQEAYDRIYGDDPRTVIRNRANWLANVILPERQKLVREVDEELDVLEAWLNS